MPGVVARHRNSNSSEMFAGIVTVIVPFEPASVVNGILLHQAPNTWNNVIWERLPPYQGLHFTPHLLNACTTVRHPKFPDFCSKSSLPFGIKPQEVKAHPTNPPHWWSGHITLWCPDLLWRRSLEGNRSQGNLRGPLTLGNSQPFLGCCINHQLRPYESPILGLWWHFGVPLKIMI